MPTYSPIDCSDHDYLEIACTDGYDVEVVLAEGNIRGRAITTETRAGEEFFRVATSDGATTDIRMDNIQRIIVHSSPRRFDSHSFLHPACVLHAGVNGD